MEKPEENLTKDQELINTLGKMSQEDVLDFVNNYEIKDIPTLKHFIENFYLLAPEEVLARLEDMVVNPTIANADKKKSGSKTRFINSLSEMLDTLNINTDFSSYEFLDFIPAVVDTVYRLKELDIFRENIRFFSDYLSYGQNPFYQENPMVSRLYSLPFFNLQLVSNYGWILPDELASRYVKGDLQSMWNFKVEKKSTADNKKRLKELSSVVLEAETDTSITSFDQLKDTITEIIGLTELGNLYFGKYLDTNYFVSLMLIEVFGNGEREVNGKKGMMTPHGRVLFSDCVLKHPNASITLTPSLHDKAVSFGSYQTLESTHKGIVKRHGKKFELPAYDQALSFSQQILVASLLAYSNLLACEKAFFSSKSDSVEKNRKKIFDKATDDEKRKFAFQLTSMSHNLGSSRIVSAINDLSNKEYRSFKAFIDDFDQALAARILKPVKVTKKGKVQKIMVPDPKKLEDVRSYSSNIIQFYEHFNEI